MVKASHEHMEDRAFYLSTGFTHLFYPLKIVTLYVWMQLHVSLKGFNIFLFFFQYKVASLSPYLLGPLHSNPTVCSRRTLAHEMKV